MLLGKRETETPLPVYTDGFEAIYALEEVNLKTVRKLVADKVEEAPQVVVELVEEPQAQFEFVGEERMDSLRLKEPVRMLRLSPQAERVLVAAGKKTLGDLASLEGVKGLGQGHIDEIRAKRGPLVARTPVVEWKSLVHALLGWLDKKAQGCFLEGYGLEGLVSMNSAETTMLKHMSADQRQTLVVEGREAWAMGKGLIETTMSQVRDAFLIPWMRSRGGFSSEEELLERLLRVSDDPVKARPIVRMIAQESFAGAFPFAEGLVEAEKGLYCTEESIRDAFILVVGRAKSYFYKPGLSYPLNQLVGYLAQEFGQRWQSFHETFVVNALRRSHSFRVRKGSQHHLVIRLS